MATISAALAIALEHLQAGRLDAAEEICRRILAVESHHAGAWHLAGLVAHHQGRHSMAVDSISRAIALDDGDPQWHFNLAEALRALGRPGAAAAAFRKAIALEPDFAAAYNNLGVVLRQAGELEEAIMQLRQAVALAPGSAAAHSNLANALLDQGDRAGATASYRRALELDPSLAAVQHNLGNALRAQGMIAEAIDHLRRAVALDPQWARAYSGLGAALRDAGDLEQATACFRRAVELQPDEPDFHCRLGAVLADGWQLGEALACYRQALQLKPDMVEAFSNLATALKAAGQAAEAVAAYRRALELQPDRLAALSNCLVTMHYVDGVTPGDLAAAHAEFERRHAAAFRAAWTRHAARRDSRLRLGFVSADFRRHPVGAFTIRFFEHCDRQALQTICYRTGGPADDVTARFQAAAGRWRDVAALSDEELSRQIMADGVDILFDLAGHTAGNRLLVFARKPAPIQISWAGYMGTTGLAAMDYLLADRWEVLPEMEKFYRERILRMPDGYVCYDPPADAPDPGPPPALDKAAVMFGSFNLPAKVTPRVVAVWAEVLRCVPGSRLLLKSHGFDDPAVSARYRALFSAAHVDPARIELLGPSPATEILAHYRQVDIALDPFPYSGGLTTCEALWMGVPVVTWPGETFAARHSLSHLANVGLTDMIARDPQDYVQIATALAGDRPRLTAIRARLRDQMSASPLCDGPRFARNLTALLRDVWQRWCAEAESGLYQRQSEVGRQG